MYRIEHILSAKPVTETFRKELVQRIARNLLDIQILRLTKGQPMWGYKMKRKMEAFYGVKLRHGALYPMLSKMEIDGMLKSTRESRSGRVRKVYLITGKGEECLEVYRSVLREQMQNLDSK